MTQQAPVLELVIRGCRLVQKHPMHQDQKTDDNDQPKFKDVARTQPIMETYIGVAVPKGAEAAQGATGWMQSEWGQQIAAQAQADFPNNEWQLPGFAWKIEDGDSQIPNSTGRKNCEREGFPGHWVIRAKTGYPVKCWDHTQGGSAMTEILDKGQIKTGDYCDVALMVKGNCRGKVPAKSKGMYVSPSHFVLTREGEEIMSESKGSSAAQLFGVQTTGLTPGVAAPAALPAAPPTPPAPPAPPAPPVAPPAPPAPPAPGAPTAHTDFLAQTAEPSYSINGQVFTKTQLLGVGYTEELIAALPKA